MIQAYFKTSESHTHTMDKLIVEGGTRLSGSVNISGSKNASLPILAAALLTDEPVRISRVPDVSDTNYMLQILSQLGCSVERSSGTVRIESSSMTAPFESTARAVRPVETTERTIRRTINELKILLDIFI